MLLKPTDNLKIFYRLLIKFNLKLFGSLIFYFFKDPSNISIILWFKLDHLYLSNSGPIIYPNNSFISSSNKTHDYGSSA